MAAVRPATACNDATPAALADAVASAPAGQFCLARVRGPGGSAPPVAVCGGFVGNVSHGRLRACNIRLRSFSIKITTKIKNYTSIVCTL